MHEILSYLPIIFWDLRVRVPRSSFLSHKTAAVTYLELTCYCTAAHKWHEFGDFSTVPGFAKNYCVIWHNAQQIAVSLWGTTDGNWKSNSNNLSSTFGDLEWGMARADEKPVCYKSLLASLLNLPHMHSSVCFGLWLGKQSTAGEDLLERRSGTKDWKTMR